MTKSIKIKKTRRHGNCVPFILTNTKTGAITFKGSLTELADKLKISIQLASYHHRYDKTLTKGKSVYTITRMGYDTTIHLS